MYGTNGSEWDWRMNDLTSWFESGESLKWLLFEVLAILSYWSQKSFASLFITRDQLVGYSVTYESLVILKDANKTPRLSWICANFFPHTNLCTSTAHSPGGAPGRMRAGYPHTDHHNYKVLAHRAFGLVSLVVKPDKIQFGLTALLGRPRLESNFVAPLNSFTSQGVQSRKLATVHAGFMSPCLLFRGRDMSRQNQVLTININWMKGYL